MLKESLRELISRGPPDQYHLAHAAVQRYRPWDVWVRLAVALFGIVLAVLVGKGRLLPFLA
jgi:hypothetical protein